MPITVGVAVSGHTLCGRLLPPDPLSSLAALGSAGFGALVRCWGTYLKPVHPVSLSGGTKTNTGFSGYIYLGRLQRALFLLGHGQL
ncbi:hypothetical protein [Pelotomaculum sp. FP]|uniref:hypothetical protein n=1 Tax=Pelotomaculum sp. FP TaxID=261474 RepID=UPI001065D8EE|nr:hypothetical protein [Pelotomaculum sp. FP]